MASKITLESAASLKTQIKVALARKGIDIVHLADQSGVAYSTMCAWLNRPERLTMEQWYAINSVLKLDPGIYNAGAGFVRGGQQL